MIDEESFAFPQKVSSNILLIGTSALSVSLPFQIMSPLLAPLENVANQVLAFVFRQLQCIVNGNMDQAEHLRRISNYPEIPRLVFYVDHTSMH